MFHQEECRRVFDRDLSERQIVSGGFRKSNGSSALFFWTPSDLMTTEVEATFTLTTAGLGEDVKLVDLMDGNVYELPESMVENSGEGHLKLINVPIKDYPMALIFGEYLI